MCPPICVKLCHLDCSKRALFLPTQEKNSSRYDQKSKKKPDGLLLSICKYARELRLLAKQNTENRACIAEAGTIPLLVSLLSVSDLRTQEHAVTALLNLSIYEDKKRRIITSGAVPGMVHVLKRGSMEARSRFTEERKAVVVATLEDVFSVDQYTQ